MKRKYLLAVLIAAAMPLTSMAQDDDLYFNPKKEAKEKAERRALLQRQYAEQRARRDSVYRLFWSGSDRSVDEYNRGGRIFSHYENVGKDSLGNDIIQFHVSKGVAPDSIYDDAYFAQKYADRDEDFVRTREMSRWDGFYDPWFYDYYGYGPYYWRSRMWGWHNPWRYGYYAGWYDPWFDPWYDPWYYGYCGWYGGWYDPWYYGWGGYYNPWYWGVRYTDMLAMVASQATFATTTQVVLMVLITSIQVLAVIIVILIHAVVVLTVVLASVRIPATLTITLLGVVVVILALVTAVISEVVASEVAAVPVAVASEAVVVALVAAASEEEDKLITIISI